MPRDDPRVRFANLCIPKYPRFVGWLGGLPWTVASFTIIPMRAPPKELVRFLKRFDPAIRELALEARELVLRVLAPSNESVLDVYVLALNYGFSERMKDQVVYIGVYSKHINIGFYRGAQMDDPEGVLEGAGKQLRHIKIKSPADLGTPVVRDYLQRAAPDGALRSKALKTKIYPSRRTPAPGRLKAIQRQS
jgi:hypothetical protein